MNKTWFNITFSEKVYVILRKLMNRDNLNIYSTPCTSNKQ